MKTPLIYIHGLGSDRNSSKFELIQDYFSESYDYYCLEWKNDSNILALIEQAHQQFSNASNLIIIGDSTGANFAFQLRGMRDEKQLQSKLILTSPLLNLNMRIAAHDFPETIIPFMRAIEEPYNALMICPRNDEIINHSAWLNLNAEGLLVVQVDDTHRLTKFSAYLPILSSYLSK